jgi:hypothetical protein
MKNTNIFDRGRIVTAKYLKTGVPAYDGNPLIEALPPILSTEQAAKRLAYFPKFEEHMRRADKHIRYHHIRSCLKFFSPLDIHLDLERQYACAIRMGYSERNPLIPGHWGGVQEVIDSYDGNAFDQYGSYDLYNSTAALGFNIVGVSGGGKSQSIRRILSTFPQVIYHKEYKQKNLTESQLVWLKVDCPFDGSTKGLCINLFQAVDAILNTNYEDIYVGERTSADELIPDIAKVFANHHLGILVIDEIQRLSLSKSGGVEKMLNFFVQLVNTIGVPVCLVGTFKALAIFTGNFSQMRRGTGQGDIIWDRMNYDNEWERFVRSMWKYEFTHKQTPDNKMERLKEVLYEETQGIIDLAIKAFIFAQERVIEDSSERITPGVIRSVVRDRFKMLRPALEAFKKKDKQAMIVFEDAYSTFVGKYLTENFYSPENGKEPKKTSTQITGAIAHEPETKVLLNESLDNVEKFFKTELTVSAESNLDSLLNEKQVTQNETNINGAENSFDSRSLKVLSQIQENTENNSNAVLREAGLNI